jgi:hypothetical protein
LKSHVKTCWGIELWNRINRAGGEKMSVDDMREKIVRPYLQTGKITEFFERSDTSASAKVTFSIVPHTDEEKQCVTYLSHLHHLCLLLSLAPLPPFYPLLSLLIFTLIKLWCRERVHYHYSL